MRARRLAGHPFEAAIVGLVALALALAFHRLGVQSLVSDETASVANAGGGLGHLASVIGGGDPNMALYYVLLHGWMRLFGESEVAVRSLSALLAALSVGAVALLGARIVGRAAGLAAGVLLATDAFFVEYAQTARSYALVVLLVTVSCWFFVAELERPTRATRIGYVAATALAIYAHYFSVYIVAAQALTLLALKRPTLARRRWLETGAALACLCLPAAVAAVRHGAEQTDWIARPGVGSLLRLPVDFGGGSALVGWSMAALAAYASIRLRDWRVRFLAIWLAAPVLLAFAVSLVKPIFLFYYLIGVLPALVLLAGAGLARLRGRIVGAVVLGVIVAVSAGPLSTWYSQRSNEDYRGAARYIVDSMRPGDRAIYYPLSNARRSIGYYAHRDGASEPSPVSLDAPSASRPPRIWVVLRTSDATPAARRRLRAQLSAARYRQVQVRPKFHRVAVALYTRD